MSLNLMVIKFREMKNIQDPLKPVTPVGFVCLSMNHRDNAVLPVWPTLQDCSKGARRN